MNANQKELKSEMVEIKKENQEQNAKFDKEMAEIKAMLIKINEKQ
jgi:hypothetical protein